MAAVMLLAGLVFGGVRNGLAGLLGGTAAGAAMVLRATLVLFGFTAISVELRNPAILSRLERHRLVGLSDALGVAFGALPAFTAALTGERGLWRRPSLVAAKMLQIANRLVISGGGRRTTRPSVIVTGATGSGKTTLVTAVVERLRARGLRVAGILAPGYLTDGRRTGFDIVGSCDRRTEAARARGRAGRRPPRAMEPLRVLARGVGARAQGACARTRKGQTLSSSTKSARSNCPGAAGRTRSTRSWRCRPGRCSSWCASRSSTPSRRGGDRPSWSSTMSSSASPDEIADRLTPVRALARRSPEGEGG